MLELSAWLVGMVAVTLLMRLDGRVWLLAVRGPRAVTVLGASLIMVLT